MSLLSSVLLILFCVGVWLLALWLNRREAIGLLRAEDASSCAVYDGQANNVGTSQMKSGPPSSHMLEQVAQGAHEALASLPDDMRHLPIPSSVLRLPDAAASARPDLFYMVFEPKLRHVPQKHSYIVYFKSTETPDATLVHAHQRETEQEVSDSERPSKGYSTAQAPRFLQEVWQELTPWLNLL